MDTSDSEISFDDEGNCNHCNKFLHDSKDIIYQGEENEFWKINRVQEVETIESTPIEIPENIEEIRG